ncbi:unnamed protein product [Porites evermanni]|uniref:G-protein coupled receptors family 1 profile domain-containing protein n=1 Tax=Porites evermanni TaxID=104178 RepID=A0ABN8R4P6_9CNID|nr:unnamed protein product [Porites evermanni]
MIISHTLPTRLGWCCLFSVHVGPIAVERHYTVIYPRRNEGYIISQKLKVIIPSYWVVALIINIPCVMITKVDGTTGESRELWSKEWMGKTNSQLSWLLLVTCVPLTVMIGLYFRVVYKLWFKPTINTSNNPTLRQKGVLRLRKRVTLMVISVSFIFGICWLPESTLYVLEFFSSYSPSDKISAVATMLIMFNSAVNPFV